MTDLTTAAQSLIVRLAAPPQWHSVYVRNEVDPETKQFVQALCVSVRPGFEDKVNVPAEHMGIPVVKVAWPD